MGKIIVSTNSSFDGVVQDPDGRDGFALGGWFDLVVGEDRAEWAGYFAKEALGADALLLGARPTPGSPSAGSAATASGPRS